MMNIMSVRYSDYGRPAVNQPQIFRSFVLLFLLANIGIAPLSLDRWVQIIKEDELYCILIGCRPGSSPPLGSYYDFMNRFWAAPLSDWYTRNKTFTSNTPETPFDTYVSIRCFVFYALKALRRNTSNFHIIAVCFTVLKKREFDPPLRAERR